MTSTLRVHGSEVLFTAPITLTAAEVRDVVPGAERGDNDSWKAPLSRRSAQGLRTLFTGYPVQLAPQDGKALAAAADAPPTYDIRLSSNGENLHAKFEYHVRYRDALRDAGGRFDYRIQGWKLPVTKARDLMDIIESRELDLLPEPAVQELVKVRPLPGADGSLASLMNIPVTALEYVQQAKPYRKKTLAERLEKFGVGTAYDLITSYPLRYIDRSTPTGVRDLVEGEDGVVVGVVTNVETHGDGKQKRVRIIVEDEAGNRITITYFNQAWLAYRYRAGLDVIVSGKYAPYRPKGRDVVIPSMSNAKIDLLEVGAGQELIVPVYPQSQTGNVFSQDIASAVKELFERVPPANDYLPAEFRERRGFMPLPEAYQNIHYPTATDSLEAARTRLAYEEFLRLQALILSTKKESEHLRGIPQPFRPRGAREAFEAALPYSLTGAQSRVMNEIAADSASTVPMRRMVQGDVGSGKTTIAHLTILNTYDNGHQAALMAPTEILAEQLHQGIADSLEGTDIVVEFLGSKTPAGKRRKILEALTAGKVHALVGTNALLSDDVIFSSLGTVIIDEQHRFGALQRDALRDKRGDAFTPHMLVMTATPIPRSGAMVLYGDLDMSILDEMPPGRTPIKTIWLEDDSELVVRQPHSEAWTKIKEQVSEGHQAYVVASLIEDNENISAASTVSAYEALQYGPLSGLRLGMVHGKMPRAEREAVMSEFAAGDIDVLVSTTVIEVGVNVPNATVMVILEAGRFGMAQLHQIRGRVGRSSLPSVCYLVGDTETHTGIARLEALVASTDGFYLSERDLEIRGEGTLFGTAQSGESDLKIASLRKDLPLLEAAREDAEELLREFPELAQQIIAEMKFAHNGESIRA